MKKCTYCGKEYPDDADACPIDGNSLASGIQSSEPNPDFVIASTRRTRIARFSVVQTAKVVTLCYVAFSLMFIPFGIMMIIAGDSSTGTVYLLMPIIYGIIGFPATALGCWVYNLLAKNIGGIEVVVEEERFTATP